MPVTIVECLCINGAMNIESKNPSNYCSWKQSDQSDNGEFVITKFFGWGEKLLKFGNTFPNMFISTQQ